MSIQEVHIVLKAYQSDGLYVFRNLGDARLFEQACRHSGEDCVLSSEPVLGGSVAADVIQTQEKSR